MAHAKGDIEHGIMKTIFKKIGKEFNSNKTGKVIYT